MLSAFIRFNGQECILKVITNISDLKRTQRALEEREQRYQSVLEAFPYTISITRVSDSRFVEVNQGFTKRTGYAPAEVIGKSSLEVKIFKDPSDRERLRDAMFRDGQVDGMEIVFQGKAGRTTDALVSCRRIKFDGDDCLMVVSTDIGDLKKAQRALHESEESHRTILEAAPYSIAISRLSDWTYILANDTLCRRTGYSKEEVIGRTTSDIGLYKDPADRGRFIEMFRKNGKVDRLEVNFQAKDGSPLESLVSARPIRFKGEDCVLTIATDIADLKPVQRALSESEASYRTIMQAAPYSITISRLSDGRYVEVNDAFTHRIGYTREEAVGRTSLELNLYHERDDYKRLLQMFQDQGFVDNIEIRYRTKSGAFTDSLASARPIMYKGEPCFLFISSNIDELKKIQRALSEREESYRTILDTAPYAIVITRLSDATYMEVNDGFCRHIGYSREEALGRTPFDLNVYENPADRARIMEIVRRQGQAEGMEVRFRTKEGRILESLISISPIRYYGEDCLLAMTVDINALKQTQRKLEESEARFRTIFETAADPICLSDLETGRFIDVNQAACHHLGYDKENFLKMSLRDITDPQCAYPLKDLSGRPAGEHPLFFEAVHMRKDGSRAIVEVSSQLIEHERRKTLLSIARDVTQRKETEKELESYRYNLEQMVAERTNALKAAQNELVKREKLAVLGQLTATVSHELRNPLGVIRSSNFYLQRRIKEKDEKTDKHFRRIEEQVTICEAIVADLLEYTRGRHVSLIKESVAPWLVQVVEQLKEQEGIQIEMHLSKDLPPIPHDQEKLRRVINVLLNAIQAVKTKAEDANDDHEYIPMVEVKTTGRNKKLVIEVRDNGIGMSEETCRRAFEPLFTTRARGTGIGLANVKKIIEEHGGSIVLDSQLGQGTRITISLPYNSKH